jgi:DNA-binding beta-propeller fold protein YncE
MSGTRHAAVPTPDGQWLFSLYINAQTGPFIHALNLTNRFALCIDLPLTAQEQKAKSATWSLTLTPDGKTLYAANGELGVVSAISVDALRVVKTTRFAVGDAANNPLQTVAHWAVPSAEAKGTQGGSALTRDGRTLYVLGFHGLFSLSTADLTLRSHQFATWPLASIAVSLDGRFLYLLRADGPAIDVVDAHSGSVSSTLTTGVIPFAILHVAPPAEH